MDCKTIRFSRHALERMFERAIAPKEVERIIEEGQTINEYPGDKPYPSRLILGYDQHKPIHVVVAQDSLSGHCLVVTVYTPEPALWNASFKRKKKP